MWMGGCTIWREMLLRHRRNLDSITGCVRGTIHTSRRFCFPRASSRCIYQAAGAENMRVRAQCDVDGYFLVILEQPCLVP